MSPRLLPCPACARHVRIVEPLCPFCSETLPLSLRSAGPARTPTKRLGRAALAAFGAAALIGCGGDDAAGDTGTADTGTADTSIADSAADGAAPDAMADAMADATPPDTSIAPAYGGPIPVDASADANDAGVEDGAVGNLYGAPPAP